MTKAIPNTRPYRSYIFQSLLFMFGLLVSISLVGSLAATITLTDKLIPIIAVVATVGLGLFCYTGLRSGKKPQDLPKGIIWFGRVSMVVMILYVLEAIIIFLFTSPLFSAH